MRLSVAAGAGQSLGTAKDLGDIDRIMKLILSLSR